MARGGGGIFRVASERSGGQRLSFGLALALALNPAPPLGNLLQNLSLVHMYTNFIILALVVFEIVVAMKMTLIQSFRGARIYIPFSCQ